MKKWFITRLMRLKLYRWTLINVIPFIRFTTYYPDMRGKAYHRGYRLLKPGDVILTIDKRKLTTKLIPGEFAHAAFCVRKDEFPFKEATYEIAEMTHKGFTKSHFFDLCKEADRVVIIRFEGINGSRFPADRDQDYIEQMIAKVFKMEGAQYDVTFMMGPEFLYCSELIYLADIENRIDCSLEDLAGLGRPYISPDGLYKAKNRITVWDSENDK